MPYSVCDRVTDANIAPRRKGVYSAGVTASAVMRCVAHGISARRPYRPKRKPFYYGPSRGLFGRRVGKERSDGNHS